MPRPFTRAQALQNAAFLKALRRTGNARAAARELGVHRSTFTKRRARSPALAADWDAALAVAHASLATRTAGQPPREPCVIRTTAGHLQLRRAPATRLTRDAEQAFLAALAATANVRLSAAAAGFSHSAFYARRKRSPAFAREMQMALEQGYERLEMALLATIDPASHADDAWRHNEPPPIPPMTPDQALQLLHLHHKTAKLWAEHPYMKRYPGESREAMTMRLSLLHEARMQRDRERFQVMEAARRDRDAPSPFEPPPPALPDLAQVTGWSKASGKAPHHDGVALFGGWRLNDIAEE